MIGSLPVANLACPVCGEANACAPARSGSFETPCWCEAVTITRETIDRLPPEQRGVACLCARCATAPDE